MSEYIETEHEYVQVSRKLNMHMSRATLIVARAHILSRPRVMCSQVRML